MVVGSEVRLEARYDDNVLRTQDRVGDLVWLVSPQLGVSRRGVTTLWAAQARLGLVSYAQSTSAPSLTQATSFRATYAPWENSAIATDVDFAHYQDARELDPLYADLRGALDRAEGSVRLVTPHVESSFTIDARGYQASDRTDATTRWGTFSLLPVRGRSQAWLVTAKGRDFLLSGDKTLRTNAVTGGLRRRHSERFESEVGLGAVQIDSGSQTPRTRRLAFVAAATARGSGPDGPLLARVRVERDAVTWVSVETWKRFSAALVSANYRAGLEAEGGRYTQVTMNHRASVAVSDTLAFRAALTVEGSYGWLDPYATASDRGHTWRGGISLSAPVFPSVIGQIGYDYVRQKDPIRAIPLDYARNRIVASITAELH